jgi:hypothetical protein
LVGNYRFMQGDPEFEYWFEY